jgi:hypothetical protein
MRLVLGLIQTHVRMRCLQSAKSQSAVGWGGQARVPRGACLVYVCVLSLNPPGVFGITGLFGVASVPH